MSDELLPCQFCGLLAARESGKWGTACGGCEFVLNRLLRSGKYGVTELLRARYNWDKAKWIIPKGE